MSQMYINIEKYMELSQNLRRCRAGSWQMDWFLVSVIFHQKMLQTKCSFQDLATGISFKNPTACVLSTLIKQLCKPSVPVQSIIKQQTFQATPMAEVNQNLTGQKNRKSGCGVVGVCNLKQMILMFSQYNTIQYSFLHKIRLTYIQINYTATT